MISLSQSAIIWNFQLLYPLGNMSWWAYSKFSSKLKLKLKNWPSFTFREEGEGDIRSLSALVVCLYRFCWYRNSSPERWWIFMNSYKPNHSASHHLEEYYREEERRGKDIPPYGAFFLSTSSFFIVLFFNVGFSHPILNLGICKRNDSWIHPYVLSLVLFDAK